MVGMLDYWGDDWSGGGPSIPGVGESLIAARKRKMEEDQQRLALAGTTASTMPAATPPATLPGKTKSKGMLGIDPMTWLAISGAFAKGAEGGGWSAALGGTGAALQNRKDRKDEDARSTAQQLALTRMQAGDMKGAAQALAGAKGLEGDALNMESRLADRDYSEQHEDKLHTRDRGERDQDYGRARNDDLTDLGTKRGWEVDDRNDEDALKLRIAGMSRTQRDRPSWEYKPDPKTGHLIAVRIDDQNQPVTVDTGINAPGAQQRSLLSTGDAARVYAGIPGALEGMQRMKGLVAGTTTDPDTGKTKQWTKDGKPYRPNDHIAASITGAIPLVGGPASKGVGGQDFQSFNQAWKQYEAALLPILSGANVTGSEATRQLDANKPMIGDSDEVIQHKLGQVERSVMGLQAAANGDQATLRQLLQAGPDGMPPAVFDHLAQAAAGGAEPADEHATNGGEEPVQIRGDDDFDQLAPGTIFIGPDGKRYRK